MEIFFNLRTRKIFEGVNRIEATLNYVEEEIAKLDRDVNKLSEEEASPLLLPLLSLRRRRSASLESCRTRPSRRRHFGPLAPAASPPRRPSTPGLEPHRGGHGVRLSRGPGACRSGLDGFGVATGPAPLPYEGRRAGGATSASKAAAGEAATTSSFYPFPPRQRPQAPLATPPPPRSRSSWWLLAALEAE